MSKVFVTSDLHFSHKNIIKYCPESRGHYQSVEEMDESIISNINSVVGEDDILIIAGDIGFCNNDQIAGFLKRINGWKKLVWGNHDKKFRESTEFKRDRGSMKVIWDGDYLEFEHKTGESKFKFVVSHFPFLIWDRAHHGSISLCGHLHSSEKDKNIRGMNVRQLDVGVDGNNMYPYDVSTICEMMKYRTAFKHGHHDGTRD